MDLTDQQITEVKSEYYNDNAYNSSTLPTIVRDNTIVTTTENKKNSQLSLVTVDFTNRNDMVINISDIMGCNKSSIKRTREIYNARLVRHLRGYLITRSICFYKPMIFTEDFVKDILKYIPSIKTFKNAYKQKYSIEFVTRDLENTCSMLSNKTLDQLNEKNLEKLKRMIVLYIIKTKIVKISAKELTETLNNFIECYNNESILPKKLSPAIKVKLKFDKNLNFLKFEATPYIINVCDCDKYNSVRSLYYQMMSLLPSKLVFKSEIFDNIFVINPNKNDSIQASELFIANNKTDISRCDVSDILNTYSVLIEDNNCLPYKSELKEIKYKEFNKITNIDVYSFIGVIMMCTIFGIPLIIAIIIYFYCMKKKPSSNNIPVFNKKQKSSNINTLLYEV